MEIRELRPGDASEWWHLRLEALERETLAFGKAVEEHQVTPVETIASRIAGLGPGSFYLGAFDEGLLIGAVTFIRDTGVKERHKGHIYGVYVTGGQRGKGVGRALLEDLLRRAAADPTLEQITLAVAVGNTPAQTLYRSLGFETYGIEPRALKVGSAYVDEEHMYLRIA